MVGILPRDTENFTEISSIYRYCTVLYCTVLYCTVLNCTVLYYTVLYWHVLCCSVLYSNWPFLACATSFIKLVWKLLLSSVVEVVEVVDPLLGTTLLMPCTCWRFRDVFSGILIWTVWLPPWAFTTLNIYTEVFLKLHIKGIDWQCMIIELRM